MSKNTVKSYLKKADEDPLSIKSLLALEDPVLEARFHAGSPAYKDDRFDELKTQMDYYQYRDTVPNLIGTLAKCLPNNENNPGDSELYEAFQSGNVQAVKEIPRHERKQLFITQFAMKYSESIESANFPEPGARVRTFRRRGSSRRGGGAMDMMMDPMMMGFEGMMPGGPMMGPQTMPGRGGEVEDEEGAGAAGFTVLIEGYSPYKEIAELLDSPSVANDSARWGLVTRFEKLAELFPGGVFELFGKHEVDHFTVETGWVDVSLKDMPSGIGEPKEIERVPQEPGTNQTRVRTGSRSDFVYSEQVLIDPMTGEEISKTYDIYTQQDINQNPELTERDLGRKKFNKLTGEEIYIERDQWFRIKAKFIWTEAPVEKESGNKAAGGMMGM